jgi:hypothetical protein
MPEVIVEPARNLSTIRPVVTTHMTGVPPVTSRTAGFARETGAKRIHGPAHGPPDTGNL